MQQAIEKMSLKRIAINISRVFYKINHFTATESFCNRPFIILKLGGGWPEKFVRSTPPPIADWRADGQGKG
jgi:hypothetical protein